MTQMRLLKKAVLLSGVAIISFAATAQAGFEWKGPLEPPRAAVEAPMPDAAPQQDNMAPIGSPEMAPAPAAQAPAAMAPVEAAPMAAAPAPMAPVADGADVLSGFGSDLPLVMALQQIVPAGYQLSFANGVNPGTTVSWEGGKPWQNVLSDTLSKQGLGYRLQNNTVVVVAGSGDMPAAAPASAPAPQMSDAAVGMTPAPAADDMAPVAIATAPKEEAMPAPVTSEPPAAQPQTVTIHREKPSSLLERLGWNHNSPQTENVAVQSDAAAPAPVTSEPPVIEKTASATAVAASATDVGATPATPVSAASPAVAANANWGGTKGQTLRDVLKGWSDKAGVELYWSIDYDYRLSGDVGYTGSYDEAVGSLLDKFASVRPQPYGQLHQSASGPRVLVVKSYDLTR